ncbi:hypothetical protein IC229_00140 [Spirosoma sp. BT702]|uniref:Lipocalin-like domain-containing protein n=1 Tax=Spirosoma profusum TaxID=2771354 RepID=A0A927APT9_9BACT|nr:hypothetical protein [Spirosoma profusum]MBD2699026.1 hypothetical protein [Spirosoma profusum]
MMKRYAVGIVLLLICAMGCQRDEAPTIPSLLFRNWHLIRTRDLSSNNWRTWDSDAYYTVEYKADGNIVYRRNNVLTEADCCSPRTYTFLATAIQYTSWYFCPNGLCATNKKAAITQLSENQLELTDHFAIYQYEAAK